jgi:diguanylate cyclase (GGDEF)-like protein
MVSGQLEARRAPGLAGIGNREEYECELMRQRKLHEQRGMPLSLLVIEIDLFPQFHAANGLPASDECLDRLAEAISDSARCGGATAFVGGPGRFTVLLPETDAREAERIAEEIRFQSESLVISHPRSPVSRYLTVSIGVATAQGGESRRGLLRIQRDAESALAHARQQGRNQIVHAELMLSATN